MDVASPVPPDPPTADRPPVAGGDLRRRIVRGTLINAVALARRRPPRPRPGADRHAAARARRDRPLRHRDRDGDDRRRAQARRRRRGVRRRRTSPSQALEFQRAFTLELAISAVFALILCALAPVVAAIYGDAAAARADGSRPRTCRSPSRCRRRRGSSSGAWTSPASALLQGDRPGRHVRRDRAARRRRRGRVEPRDRPGGGQPRGRGRGRARVAVPARPPVGPGDRAALPALLGLGARVVARGPGRAPGPGPRVRPPRRPRARSASSRSPRRSRATSTAPTRSSTVTIYPAICAIRGRTARARGAVRPVEPRDAAVDAAGGGGDRAVLAGARRPRARPRVGPGRPAACRAWPSPPRCSRSASTGSASTAPTASRARGGRGRSPAPRRSSRSRSRG